MKKNKFMYVLILLVFFWIMIMYDGWQTEVLFQTVIFIPVVLSLFAFVVSRMLKVSLDHRTGYIGKNGGIRKQIQIKNKTIFPVGRLELFVKIEDSFGNVEKRVLAANVNRNSQRIFWMKLNFLHCGTMNIRVEKIRVYDTFLLTRYTKKLELEQMFCVYPEIMDKISFQIPENIFDEDEEETSISGRHENRGELRELREYQEGDDYRNIHWKLSSKSESLLVKHYENSQDSKVYIHVNTQVRKESKYFGCDRIMGIVYAVIKECRERGKEYELIGYGEDGVFPLVQDHIPEHIEVREEPKFLLGEAIRKKSSGVHLYITTVCPKDNMLWNGVNHIYLPADLSKAEQMQYELEKENLVWLMENETEEPKKEECLLTPDNDRNRNHKRLSYENQLSYQIFFAMIAFAASCLAVLSIYDVLLIEQDFGWLTGLLAFFVVLHVVLGVWKNKRNYIKGIIIFLGYILILFLSDFSLIEGGRQILGIVDLDITQSSTEYGFLKHITDEIQWVVILVAYAMVDVLYFFSMDFILFVHLAVVVPLVSCSLLVRNVPPSYATFIAILYFSVLFAVYGCLKHGKGKSRKYLSDDYDGTGRIAVNSGILTLFVAALAVGVCYAGTMWGGYERPDWMKQSKQTIETILETDSLDEALQMIAELVRPEVKVVPGEEGKLNDLEKVSYEDIPVLRVVKKNLGHSGEESFYLKSYTGSVYNGDAWQTRDTKQIEREREYLERVWYDTQWYSTEFNLWNTWQRIYGNPITALKESLSYYYAECQQQGLYAVTDSSVEMYITTVTSLMQNDRKIYKPYFSITTTENVQGKDGYEQFPTSENEKDVKFRGYYLGDSDSFETERYTAQTDISSYGDWMVIQLQEWEEDYLEYGMEDYLEIPQQLTGLKEEFAQVEVLHDGEMITLVSGDKQYEQIGYQPYIRYVRNYFIDHGYRYSLDAVRQNSDSDFINDFMERKTGYCIHFATAGVMMFRSMGIPARYAEGYFVSSDDMVKKEEADYEYEIKDSSAHAWVEIYMKGIGWVPIEVTPGSENFVYEQEETQTEEPETQTTENPQTDIAQQTTEVEENTTFVELTTTPFLKETQKQINGAEKEEKSDIVLTVFLVLLGAAALLLIGSNLCRRKMIMRVEQGEPQDRVNEMERQMFLAADMGGTRLTGQETCKEKTRLLWEQLQQSELSYEEIEKAVSLFEKNKYAPPEALSEQEVRWLCNLVRKYAENCYGQVSIYKKIVYRYIKCLYLKGK